MKKLWLLAALSACHDGSASHVVLDLRALQQHAAQVGIAVDRIELVVTAVDLAPLRFAIDPAAPTFEIDLPAGPQRSFEVTALVSGAVVEIPAYWGLIVVDLVPRTEIDVVIPIFPAGQVTGTVQTSDGTPLPSDLSVGFDLTAAPPERPPHLDAAINSGTFAFARPLPTGSYELHAAFTAGVTYAASPNFAFTIAQGAITDLGVVVLAPPGQVVVGAPPEGVPVGGVVSARGLASGGASTLRSTGYTLQLGAFSPINSTVMQSTSYRLRPAAEPLRSLP